LALARGGIVTDDQNADSEKAHMLAAIDQARKCMSEDDRVHPKVGVVVIKDGKVLAEAYRGEYGPGDHAEFTVLEKKLKDGTLTGCTVYTTLEPCTTRNHPKLPCAQRLIERKPSRVVIGMLDPNRTFSAAGCSGFETLGFLLNFSLTP
jgi:pyrimidine deaminase RibD-like protein